MKRMIIKVFSAIIAVCCISVFYMSGVSAVHAKGDNVDVATEECSAKKRMEEEEKYIVDLVSKKTGKQLKNADWKVCLDYLRENYDLIITETDVDADKVKSYVNAYTYVELEEKEPNEKVNYVVEARAAYSPTKVTAYTNKY
ncbi:MAG: hypothetical protein Q4F98_05690 [Lachnospiraceae bacterium]|nr:hypothetical protein [Lachnospiraceae bacterium]